ncbi:MAG: hypothetical protein AMXMBFR7_46010 [Planctomycetota bacterium]
MKLFFEGELRVLLEKSAVKLKHEIDTEPEGKLLGVNEPDYIRYLVAKYRIEPLAFDWNAKTTSTREELIEAGRFPFNFGVTRGGNYPKQVITIHIPFSGDERLLALRASTFTMSSVDVEFRAGEICFDIINWQNDAALILKEANQTIDHIKSLVEYTNRDVVSYNSGLEGNARAHFAGRKSELLKRSSVLMQLGIPIKRSSSVPHAFTIPLEKKPALVSKPPTSTSAYSPEPTLDNTTYHQILTVCRDLGREMERHPSLFADKGEEALRDCFILMLSPHFQGGVTGETFNKQGKTDILIRYDGKNAFIAECKFWGGGKQHSATIDQILSYLTWRDSKAAILYFVRNLNLDPVFAQIKGSTPGHSSFAEHIGNPEDGWFNYRLYLPNDKTRNVYLAILCFHFPQT